MLNTEGLCLGCMSDNGGEKICPICGFDNSTQNPANCLPLKSYIQNRYLIGRVLEIDGEGITYIGWDKAKTSKINIKEYFPTGFATRNPDKTVSISDEGRYTFNQGLLEFIDINRSIMISSLPALIPVFDVFEENGTAYAVKELVSGITLEDFLIKNGGSLKWEQARALFLPVIDTVGGMNDIGYIHGGLSGETIIVGRDGKLRIDKYSIKKLRRGNSELDFTLYGGYAAFEQYGSKDLHVDTYTDVYGLCATLFRVLIGTPPPESVQRINNDVMTIPARFAEELPRQVLAALANGLQVLPQNRTRTIEVFKNEMVYGEIETPAPVKRPVNPVQADVVSSTKQQKKKKKSSSGKYVLISALCTVAVCAVIAVFLFTTVFKNTDKDNTSFENSASQIVPEIESLGDVDSGAQVTAKKYPVPDLIGKSYAEVIEDDTYEMFEFVFKTRVFSNDCPRGTVCKQSLKAGSEAVRDTKIELTVSLGPKEVGIANLKGLTEKTPSWSF